IAWDGNLDHSKKADVFSFLHSPYVTLNSAHLNKRLQEQLSLVGSLSAKWNFVDHFTAGVNFSATLTELKNSNITDPKSLLAPWQVRDDGNTTFGGRQYE